MAQRIREFTTSALNAIAVPKTWPGPRGIQLSYYDKTHYQVNGQHHMNRVIAKIEAEGHLDILRIDKAENMYVCTISQSLSSVSKIRTDVVHEALTLTVSHRGTIHKATTEPHEETRITVAMMLEKALQCTCHWFMDGRVTYRKDGKKSECYLSMQVGQSSANSLSSQGDELPPDITDKWIDREDAEEAAKAAASERARAASR